MKKTTYVRVQYTRQKTYPRISRIAWAMFPKADVYEDGEGGSPAPRKNPETINRCQWISIDISKKQFRF